MPGTPPTSPRFGAPRYSDTVDTASFSAQVNGITDVFDDAAMYLTGTSATRLAIASPVNGCFFYETDTTDLWLYNGTTWGIVMAAAGTWQALSLGSGVTAITGYTPEARLLGDAVEMRGALQNTSGSSMAPGTTIATSPFQPADQQPIGAWTAEPSGTLASSGLYTVSITGVLSPYLCAFGNNAVIVLSGVRYYMS